MPGLDSVGPTRPASQLVTVFGGSGFLGRHVVRALAKRGYRIRVAARRPDLALFLQPLGRVGQIVAVQANLRDRASIARAVEHADVVVNLVGILQESGSQSFHRLQAEGAAEVARAAAAIGARMVHVSALGADAASPSHYASSKAQGEAGVFAARPEAVVFRPSIIFGQGDSFFNRFAGLARALPVLPIAGADTRMQPVFVGDVAEAVALAVDGKAKPGTTYELGGPEILTLKRLVEYTLDVTMRRRLVLPLPGPAARIQARALEIADTLTLGLLPDSLQLTRDQVLLLEHDIVVADAAMAEGRTLDAFGIAPTAVEAVVPGYLWRFRKAGQFTTGRGAPEMARTPDLLAPEPVGPGSAHHPQDAGGPAVGQKGAGAGQAPGMR